MKCILCQTSHSAPFKVDKKPLRSYFHCAECDLIFLNPAERLAPQEEKTRYDQHDSHGSAGHGAFLEPLVKEIDGYISAAKVPRDTLSVFDFGCGPQPVLSQMFANKGYKTAHYDLYYHPNQDLLRKSYHVITSTEVWEHLYEPRKEIEILMKALKAGGLLGVMTSAHHGEAVFHDWHYRRDTTHVTFFSENTMNWLAKTYRLQIIKARSPYWVFQKMI